PHGGRLTIATGTLRTTGVASEPVPAGDWVTLAVADTGHGIDPASQPLVFEPFFTTKEPGKGTGLGLSIVYGIVEQSGGRIALESEPEQGTTVTGYRPGLRGHAVAQALAASGRRPRVLYISGYPELGGSEGAIGDHPLLPKPFTPGELVRKVRAVLDELQPQ